MVIFLHDYGQFHIIDGQLHMMYGHFHMIIRSIQRNIYSQSHMINGQFHMIIRSVQHNMIHGQLHITYDQFKLSVSQNLLSVSHSTAIKLT
jgi:hypothetical protein